MKTKFTTLIIKQELKDRLTERIIRMGKKISYPKLLEELLKQTEEYDKYEWSLRIKPDVKVRFFYFYLEKLYEFYIFTYKRNYIECYT